MENSVGIFTKEQEIACVTKATRPHVVILGAGASLATCLKGDILGKRLPLMDNFVEVLELSSILRQAGIQYDGRNFEEIYAELSIDQKYSLVRRELEDVVYDYFCQLRLPDCPTIYDHLVLSLRPKDVIATFNWDPFLVDAYRRNKRASNKPKLYFLHGNVRIGYCENDNVMGVIGNTCSRCETVLTPSRLLYPIGEKNYHVDGFISSQWSALQNAMSNAFMISIFGYGAPASDVSAIDLMKEGWGNKYNRTLEQTEIIDVKAEKKLLSTWEPFIHTHHYELHSSFYDSWIANHPRRTFEAWRHQYIDALFIDDNPIPKDADFPNMHEWFDKLIDVEERQP